MADGTCTVNTCNEPILCRRWCSGHYNRWKKTGDVQANRPLARRAPRNPGARCIVPACVNGNTRQGLCGTHAYRLRVHGDVQAHLPVAGAGPRRKECSYAGCPLPHLAKGLCGTHYRRQLTHGDPSVNKARQRKPCTAPQCDRLAETRGHCQTHAARVKRTGEVQADKPIVPGGWRPLVRCAEKGCRKKSKARGLCRRHYAAVYLVEVKADPQRWAASRAYRREWHAAWRAANPGRVAELHRRWVADNRDIVRIHDARKRMRRRGAPAVPYTARQLAERMRYWGNRCWMCRGPFEAVDHVKPLAKGGWDTLSNTRPACRSCNSSKQSRWPFPLAYKVLA
jgi:hypothetical protein